MLNINYTSDTLSWWRKRGWIRPSHCTQWWCGGGEAAIELEQKKTTEPQRSVLRENGEVSGRRNVKIKLYELSVVGRADWQWRGERELSKREMVK